MKEMIVKHRDVELYTRIEGTAGKPVIVFLHGYPDCHKTWDKQIDALKNDFQLIRFDMRGVGESTWSAKRNAYLIDNLLSDIEAVIDQAVGKESQVHLVGHDWGSVIGWSFITEPYYARRVLSFTSMSGPHLGLMFSWARRNLLSRDPARIQQTLKQFGLSWYVYLFNLPIVPESIIRNAGQTIWSKVLEMNGVAAGDDYLGLTQGDVEKICINPLGLYRQNPLSPPEVPQKGAIDVPVQLIIPTQDKFISENLFEYYSEYVPRLSKHYVRAKHWAHHSHAHEFNRWVSHFVQGIDSEKNRRAA